MVTTQINFMEKAMSCTLLEVKCPRGLPVFLSTNNSRHIADLLRNPWAFTLLCPSFMPREANLPCAPRNITSARGRLLQIAAFLTIEGCCEMLKQFGFRPKMYYLCLTKEERAHKHRVFSSFYVRKSVVLPRM